jgi:hypothetical protein
MTFVRESCVWGFYLIFRTPKQEAVGPDLTRRIRGPSRWGRTPQRRGARRIRRRTPCVPLLRPLMVAMAVEELAHGGEPGPAHVVFLGSGLGDAPGVAQVREDHGHRV